MSGKGIKLDDSTYDKSKTTEPNARVDISANGVELCRSIDSGRPTWYLSFVHWFK
jgi:hypothetical protein